MNHLHVCSCGTELRCSMEPDKCAIVGSVQYQCPSCAMQQMDDYFAADIWKENQRREAQQGPGAYGLQSQLGRRP